MIEICTVGGFNEIGRNCTAIKVDDEVVVLDLGLLLDKYIAYTENEDVIDISAKKLLEIGAVPDISLIDDWRKKVVAIVPSHAHLDHLGAIPFLSNKFDAPIICTPFSGAVLKAILRDEKKNLRNEIITLNLNSTYKVSEGIKIEFIAVTHSTPQSAIVAVHTKYGTVVYANDLKFDNHPVLGKKPNYARLKMLGEKGVECLIINSIYSQEVRKTPSERIVKDMLEDVLLGTETEGKAIVITTFASHLARLKSIIEFGKKLDRKILFLGRSLEKYTKAGESINLVDFSKDVKIIGFRRQVARTLKKIKKKGEYLIVCTGHQGEHKAVLSRLANDEFDFKLEKGDLVIFSSKVIPSAIHVNDRERLEKALKDRGVRIFRDIHVSGHLSREDHRDLISMLKPKVLIPSHCGLDKATGLATLAEEMGYKIGEDVHLMQNGRRLILTE